MIGIFFSLLSLGNALVDGTKKSLYNIEAMKRAEERKTNGTDRTNTYFDWRGVRRDMATNQPVRVDFEIVENHGEDQCIRDIHGNVLRNLSQEKRDAAEAEARAKGNRTVVFYKQYGNSEGHRDRGGDGYCEGPQFKDLNTGELYVARELEVRDENNNLYFMKFYMDFDGNLVREADCEKHKRYRLEKLPDEKIVEEFIKAFNGNQRRERYSDKMYFKDNFGNRKIDGFMLGKYFYHNDKIVSLDC